MIIDLVIIILIISAIIRGSEIGFIQQALSTVGFFGGLLLGTLLEPQTVALAHTQLSRALVTIATTLGMAFIFLSIGEFIGMYLKHKVVKLKFNKLDNILGSGLSIISVLVGVWLGVGILRTLPYMSFQQDLKNSRIVAVLDRHLPPAPNIIASLGHLVDPNGFPRVFNGNEPPPPGGVNLPPASELAAAVSKDRPSVVKIVGDGCGGIVEGSGFVISSNEIATNAHVVAGISQPFVEDDRGNHVATVIYFNPNLDFALLRVDGLAGGPLNISGSIAKDDTPASAMGYPGGGNFKARRAVVMQEFYATGSNIYAQGNTNRQVYEISANIIPGNSGGPLINVDGEVIGIVFAQSTAYNDVGYALVAQPIINIINHTSSHGQAVSTGSCAA